MTEARTLQTIAYFADVLAPLWGFPVLYPHVLKTAGIRRSPEIQRSIDGLVGRGLLVISKAAYDQAASRLELRVEYGINSELVDPVIRAISLREQGRREGLYIAELSTALVGLGSEALWLSAFADATYGDTSVDMGTVVDVLPFGRQESRSVRSARAFQQFVRGADLSSAELTNLYVRHLYSVMAGSVRGDQLA